MQDRIRFFLNRVSERLWVRPLILCVLAIIVAIIAKGADYTEIGQFVPDITADLIKTLLTIISASMLGIATFSVASMVSAYASASTTATPRTFALVIADDVSQNALSAFIGAFIFSIVSLIALEHGYYGQAGRFTLFTITLLVFAIVIVTFIRWVDNIARLGRLGTTIDKVESATAAALARQRTAPRLGGVPVTAGQDGGIAVYGDVVGYVQRIEMDVLQSIAEELNGRIEVAALPGMFAAPGRALARVTAGSGSVSDSDKGRVAEAFLVDGGRTFDEDPRFGLIVLSEIGSRAMSPGINDPGTAIDVIGTLLRLLVFWGRPPAAEDQPSLLYDRVAVPEIDLEGMFDDAFGALIRDGAGTIEVVLWMMRAFDSLSLIENRTMRDVALRYARTALARAEGALDFEQDLEAVRAAAQFAAAGRIG